MSGYQLKLGMIFVGCLSLLLAGCTNDYEQQTDPVDEQTQDVSYETALLEADEGDDFVVLDLKEEDGIKLAYVIPIDEADDILETCIDNNCTAISLEGASVEIEDGRDSTRREATSEDIVEGDVLRFEMSEPGTYEKIVIIRQVD